MNAWEANVCNNCAGTEATETITECITADTKTKTLSCCPSTDMPPCGNHVTTIKVPVVLSEVDIQVGMESDVTFDEDVYEIKRIRKNAYITQFQVMRDRYNPTKGKLFVGGYVRSNIEYATIDCQKDDIVNGEIKHMTKKSRFRCFTDFTFYNLPDVGPQYAQEEYTELGEKTGKCNKLLTGKNQCKDVLYNEENFIEKIYCEFEQSRIMEINLHEEANGDCRCSGNNGPTLYSGMIEKMGVHLHVKVLQKQQVRCLFNPITPGSQEEA